METIRPQRGRSLTNGAPSGKPSGPLGPKEAPIGVRFQSDVKAALEKLAKADDRSISYVINKIVTDYLRARKLIK